MNLNPSVLLLLQYSKVWKQCPANYVSNKSVNLLDRTSIGSENKCEYSNNCEILTLNPNVSTGKGSCICSSITQWKKDRHDVYVWSSEQICEF